MAVVTFCPEVVVVVVVAEAVVEGSGESDIVVNNNSFNFMESPFSQRHPHPQTHTQIDVRMIWRHRGLLLMFPRFPNSPVLILPSQARFRSLLWFSF